MSSRVVPTRRRLPHTITRCRASGAELSQALDEIVGHRLVVRNGPPRPPVKTVAGAIRRSPHRGSTTSGRRESGERQSVPQFVLSVVPPQPESRGIATAVSARTLDGCLRAALVGVLRRRSRASLDRLAA